MNLAKTLIRQSASLHSAVRTFSCGPSVTTVCQRLGQFSQSQPGQVLRTDRFGSHVKQVRLMSTSQSAKLEVINVQDESDFKKRVLESSKPVVIDFHATWCGPCKLLGPRLEKLLSECDGSVLMAKVDIDDNSELALEYGVRSVPTVIGMKSGKIQSQFVGLIDDDQIQTFIDKLVVS